MKKLIFALAITTLLFSCGTGTGNSADATYCDSTACDSVSVTVTPIDTVITDSVSVDTLGN